MAAVGERAVLRSAIARFKIATARSMHELALLDAAFTVIP